MSRIGNKPVLIPSGVKVVIQDRQVAVEGPLGKLDYAHRPEVTVRVDEAAKCLQVGREGNDRASRAFHGLTRALLQNMVDGVTKGYEKRLEVVGVGYLAAVQGKTLQLRVGFANEIQKEIPAGLDVTCPDQTHVVIKGIDRQQVGQFAAEVRAIRKPEPYKGKGIRYEGEHVRRKAGKAVGA
ncbi:MAG: 50S ribosomal protein L6 [Planctomycetales bacterium]|nr:50S ribosomal protein L6 [Planctomycetales bacterium]NIM07585.1 50S ribosomal protein L6 [Planctomycetales bacterium]NIN07091.1 50S ribosomal protein L6 [Planctomycetales bacterium]NIN76185.1 50S ribosomal protein L6 [Planctomycetales bacterium]NIO33407.1 50S ribosomal protein L6 [Planctomycetales bacterium]